MTIDFSQPPCIRCSDKDTCIYSRKETNPVYPNCYIGHMVSRSPERGIKIFNIIEKIFGDE